MAAKHSTRYPLNGLTTEQFIMLLIEASHALGWRAGRGKQGLVLSTPRSAWSYGEMLLVTIDGDDAVIESKNQQFQLTGGKKNEQNLTRLTAMLDEQRSIYTNEQLNEKLQALAAEQEEYEQGLAERVQSNTLTAAEKIAMGSGGRYVTYTLIALNVLVFIAMAATSGNAFQFDIATLLQWGGNVRELTTGGEWYRLITNVFVHSGLIHVAFNMYALFYVGMYLEPLLGRWRYLTAYLACGIFASLASIAMHENVVSVGASGAIFGLYGVFLALLTTSHIDKSMRQPMLQSIAIFVGYNLLYGFKGNIDNAAHVGGLISGAVYGYMYYFFFFKKKDNMAVSIAITATAAIAGAFILLPQIQDDTAKVVNSINRFLPLQDSANAVIPSFTDSDYSAEKAEHIKTIALPIWQKWKNTIDSSAGAHLSPEMRKAMHFYKQYVDLNIEKCNFYIRRENEHTSKYNDSIAEIDNYLLNVVNSLNKH